MKRNEMMAYTLTAIIGGGLAGAIAGLVGILGVFLGLAIVGYADLVVHVAAQHDDSRHATLAHF